MDDQILQEEGCVAAVEMDVDGIGVCKGERSCVVYGVWIYFKSGIG